MSSKKSNSLESAPIIDAWRGKGVHKLDGGLGTGVGTDHLPAPLTPGHVLLKLGQSQHLNDHKLVATLPQRNGPPPTTGN